MAQGDPLAVSHTPPEWGGVSFRGAIGRRPNGVFLLDIGAGASVKVERCL